MGVRILANEGLTALYCSTSDIAFGPVFYDSEFHSAAERAESFLRFLGARDARQFSDKALLDLYAQWHAQEGAQWRTEEEGTEDVE